MEELQIDKEFQSLIPLLKPEEREGLEASIKADGCHDALVIWDGVIVDGHNRYEICQRNSVEFRTRDVSFENRICAKRWIIANQKQRRNLTPFQSIELELLDADLIKLENKERQRSGGGDRKSEEYKEDSELVHEYLYNEEAFVESLRQNSDEAIATETLTLQKVGKSAGVSHDTAAKVKKVLAEAPEDLLQKARTGDISIHAAYKEVKKASNKTLVQRHDDGEELLPQEERMVDKFRRLGELEEQGVYIGSMWSFGKRAEYAGDASFHGNSAPQVIENAILFYTQKGDLVLDPMAGSGTVLNVCEVLDRRCVAYDLTPQDPRIKERNAQKLPLEDGSVDFIFWHPPYWNMVKYSDKKEDLSNESWPGFLRLCHNVLIELERVLKKNKILVILSGDKVQGGSFYPITRSLANNAERLGFVDSGVIIKPAYNTESQIVKGKTIWAELAFTDNIKVEHDIINVFRRQ